MEDKDEIDDSELVSKIASEVPGREDDRVRKLGKSEVEGVFLALLSFGGSSVVVVDLVYAFGCVLIVEKGLVTDPAV